MDGTILNKIGRVDTGLLHLLTDQLLQGVELCTILYHNQCRRGWDNIEYKIGGRVDTGQFHLFTAQLISFSRERSGAAELQQNMLDIMVVKFCILTIIIDVVSTIMVRFHQQVHY